MGAHHQAAHGGRDGFDVFLIRADDADMGKGEGDDLPGVGRIGQDLLISRHRGVEADFAHRARLGAKGVAFERGPVGQHQNAGLACSEKPRSG